MNTAYNNLKEFVDAAYIKRTGERKGNFHHLMIDNKVKVLELNRSLIEEESDECKEAIEEYIDAFCSADKVEEARAHLTKELCDAIYVLLHAAVELEIDIPRAFEQVHRNNMLKIKTATVRDDGKLVKDAKHPKVDLKGF